MEEVKPTVRGRLIVNSPEDRAWLLLLMRNFKDAVEYAHSLMREDIPDKEIVKLLTSRILNNAHYSYSALQRAKLYREQPYLKLRKPQLYSIGRACEKGNRNIRFLSMDTVLIKMPHANGRHEWVECKVRFGKKHIPVVKELINADFPFPSGIVLNNGRFYLYVTIPLEIYMKHDSHPKVSVNSKYIAGFDLNSDRINMVIIDRDGEVIDVKNMHFPEITQHGYPQNKARDTILKSLNKLMDYAVHHNVKYFVFEKLSNIKGRRTSSRNANRKISRFPYRVLLTHARTMVRKRNGVFIQVSPAYTSVDAVPLSKKLGLDIHTASAYLLALRYLKSTNVY